MTAPLGNADFFALEAGESLDRLARIADRLEPPSADEWLRHTRVLRGSALMANQQPIARAAAAFEAVARGFREGRREWDPALREQVAQAVEEFRALVRRARDWNDDDTRRANRLTLELEGVTGRGVDEGAAARPGGERGELNTGVRAFVAREGALIASALDRASRSLAVAPDDREPLYAVLRRMQSLRGLAELGELPPLPEILDGIEFAIGDLSRLYAPPSEVDQVIAAAAHALTRAARDVAEHGRPDPDSSEARRFTDLLLRAFAIERDVVAIESLLDRDHPEPVRRPTQQPKFAAPSPLGPVELVSHGEHLCQTADLIAASRTAIERDLRLYRLVGTLRSATAPADDPVAAALVVFARSAREAIAGGAAATDPVAFTDVLRDAGQLLRRVAEATDPMALSRRLLDEAHRLDGLSGSAPDGDASPADAAAHPTIPSADSRAGDDDAVVPIESLAPADEVVVPIESLTPAEDADVAIVPIESLAPDAYPSDDRVVPIGALALDAASILPIASLAPGADDDVVPIASLAPDRAAPSSLALRSADAAGASASPLPGSDQLAATLVTYGALLDPDRVPQRHAASRPEHVRVSPTTEVREPAVAEAAVEIAELCYRGRAALERAAAVRAEISAELRRSGDYRAVQPLVDELLDLVPLALVDG